MGFSPFFASQDGLKSATTFSMPEVAVAGENHGHAGGVRGGDDFLVSNRAAGLDAGGGSGVDRALQAVGEGEHGV